MVISGKYRFVYIAIPHTGSSSMIKWCKKYYAGHGFSTKHSNEVPEEYSDFYKFTLVRNPYERMFSWWWFNKARNPAYNETFEDFLQFMVERKEYCPERHLCVDGPNVIRDFYMPQIGWCRKTNSKFYRLEDVPGTLFMLPFIFKEHAGKFPHINKSKIKPKINLTDEQRLLILNYCQEDFDAFGYDK